MEMGAFCLRADGTRYDDEGITMKLCAQWRSFFRRTRGIPQEGIWEMVPERLLPEGAAVCYFCPHTYLQYFVAHKVAPALARDHYNVGDRVRVWGGTRKQELQSLRGRCGTIQAVDRSAATMTVIFDVPGPAEVRSVTSLVTDFEDIPDSRPLISPQWRAEHPEEWERLQGPQPCPVCQDVEGCFGPMNGPVPTRCTHVACVECWEQIRRRDGRCPVCRDDLRDWLENARRTGTSDMA